MPAFLTEATRDAHLLDMLAQAAQTCRHNGQRLVLVVDGLDEDLGWTTSTDAHSTAALLPPQPPAGIRIIVAAGRTRPSLPTCPKTIRCVVRVSSACWTRHHMPQLCSSMRGANSSG